MKKTISYAALALILAGSFTTSCESNVQREKRAQENLLDAQQELRDAQIALDEEYPAFKIEAEAKIAANEKRIEMLNLVIIHPNDRSLEDARRQKIEVLNQKNRDLRNELKAYEREGSDWKAFKHKFNQDMNGLVDALKEFGTPNNQ
jgi:hypothetical protein